ncbi:MAG: hypothetical protein EBV21_12430, partial [Betaproteobacteria bacterium]|nr:hypothetical protein [Betaproteobacteria bacterium]
QTIAHGLEIHQASHLRRAVHLMEKAQVLIGDLSGAVHGQWVMWREKSGGIMPLEAIKACPWKDN